MRRIALLGKLKHEKIEEYCELHAHPWPSIMKAIREANIRNYSIYLHGDYVFSYFEYVGTDYDADMKRHAADPEVQRWWTYTHPCFVTYAIEPDCEYTPEIRQVFLCE